MGAPGGSARRRSSFHSSCQDRVRRATTGHQDDPVTSEDEPLRVDQEKTTPTSEKIKIKMGVAKGTIMGTVASENSRVKTARDR